MAREGDVEAARLLEGIGKDIQARDQAGLDIAYEDFVRKGNGITPENSYSSIHPYLEVSLFNCLETTKFQQYNPIKDALGTGIAGLGLV